MTKQIWKFVEYLYTWLLTIELRFLQKEALYEQIDQQNQSDFTCTANFYCKYVIELFIDTRPREQKACKRESWNGET